MNAVYTRLRFDVSGVVRSIALPSARVLRLPHVARHHSKGVFGNHALPACKVLRHCRSLSAVATKDAVNDTIYALSTASGKAAIAVIRISGPACLNIYQELCPGRPLPKPRIATLRRLYKPRTESDEPVVLDSGALVLYFPSPRTATGEEILELHIHGGAAVVRAVLEAIPKCDTDSHTSIRYAAPGEFTRRAFYNERLDLTQVEALGDVLSAETEQQRRLAVNGSDNSLGVRYEEWRRMLLYARGELEALIDFSEDQHFDESPAEFMGSVTEQVVRLKRQVELHITNASKGELLRNGLNLALLGAPNAGKSSLLNRIVGREAAIVSSEAGTTRDIVDVGVDIAGWLCRLGDTAGLRNSQSSSVAASPGSSIGEIEREGIRRAKARALESDVIIAVLSIERDINTSKPYLHLDPEVSSALTQCQEAGKGIIVAINKIDNLDIRPPTSVEDLLSSLSTLASSIPAATSLLKSISPSQIVPISCHEATSLSSTTSPSTTVTDPGNIQTLLRTLTSTFSALTNPSTDDSDTPSLPSSSYWTTSLSVTHRQSQSLHQCLFHLTNFLSEASRSSTTTFPNDNNYEDTDVDVDTDIVAAAEHLRFAAHCLASITGRTSGDSGSSSGGEGGDVEDVLGVVFERFCVGK